MTMHYSKTTGGFYSSAVHAKNDIPADAVDVADEAYAALLDAQAKGQQIGADADGHPIAIERPAPTPAQAATMLAAAVQAHVDAVARALGYDNVLAAISYADEPAVPKYQAEAVALRAWRSLAWAAATPLLDAIAAGGAAPTADELLAKLPKFTPPTP